MTKGFSLSKSQFRGKLIKTVFVLQGPIEPVKQIQQEVDPRLTEIEVNTEKQDFDVIYEDEKTLLRETRSPVEGKVFS